MEYAKQVMKQVKNIDALTSHDDDFPTSYSHKSPMLLIVEVCFDSFLPFSSIVTYVKRPRRWNVYALMAPNVNTIADAGRIAFGTSPSAATPAGSDNTPEPTHPLIKFNAAVGMDCSLLPSFELSSFISSEEAAFLSDFTRLALTPPLLLPPPRRVDRVFIL